MERLSLIWLFGWPEKGFYFLCCREKECWGWNLGLGSWVYRYLDLLSFSTFWRSLLDACIPDCFVRSFLARFDLQKMLDWKFLLPILIELDPAFHVEFWPILQVFLVRDYPFNCSMLLLKNVWVLYVCSPDISAGRSFWYFSIFMQ